MKIRPREIEVNSLFSSIDSISVAAFLPERRKIDTQYSLDVSPAMSMCFRGVLRSLCHQSAFKLLSALSFFTIYFMRPESDRFMKRSGSAWWTLSDYSESFSHNRPRLQLCTNFCDTTDHPFIARKPLNLIPMAILCESCKLFLWIDCQLFWLNLRRILHRGP